MRILRCIYSATFCGIEFATKTFATSARSKIIRWAGMKNEHVNGMDDNRLAKIAKNGKPNIVRPSGRSPKR